MNKYKGYSLTRRNGKVIFGCGMVKVRQQDLKNLVATRKELDRLETRLAKAWSNAGGTIETQKKSLKSLDNEILLGLAGRMTKIK